MKFCMNFSVHLWIACEMVELLQPLQMTLFSLSETSGTNKEWNKPFQYLLWKIYLNYSYPKVATPFPPQQTAFPQKLVSSNELEIWDLWWGNHLISSSIYIYKLIVGGYSLFVSSLCCITNWWAELCDLTCHWLRSVSSLCNGPRPFVSMWVSRRPWPWVAVSGKWHTQSLVPYYANSIGRF